MPKWNVAEVFSLPAPSGIPHDFLCNAACLVSSSAARLVTLHFRQILSIQLARTSLWRLQVSRIACALAVLSTVSRIAVNVLPTQLPQLVIVYCKSLCTDEKSAQDGAYTAIRALSATLRDYAPIFGTLTWLHARACRSAGVETGASSNGVIGVLSTVLGRANALCINSHVGAIITTLSLYAERNAEHRAKNSVLASSDATDVLFCSAVGNLLSLKPVLDEASRAILIRALLFSPSFMLYFLPTSKHPPENHAIVESIHLLLEGRVVSSATGLIERHFNAILSSLPKAGPCYKPQSGSWLLLSALIHTCPKTAASAFDKSVAPILMVHLSPVTNPKPEARMHALSLAHVLVCTPAVHEVFSEVTIQALIEGAVLPNLVWCAGHTANATRKAALAVLHGLVQGGALANHTQLMSKLYPALETNTQEYDTSLREMSLSCLEGIFEALPSASLQEQEFTALYPVIVKRLDDSSDLIRLKVCSTFAAFIRVTGPDLLSGTALEYCTEHFLLHLDDQNYDIQSAICRTLEIIMTISPSAKAHLSAKLHGASTSNRDPKLIAFLLPEWRGGSDGAPAITPR